MKRTIKTIIYHGRKGHPLIHLAVSGARFIMVRKKGGGVKRLYEGSKYSPGKGKKQHKLRLS